MIPEPDKSCFQTNSFQDKKESGARLSVLELREKFSAISSPTQVRVLHYFTRKSHNNN